MGRCRRRTPGGSASLTCRAGGSSTWCGEDVPISKILTETAVENTIRVNAAIGGSTNAFAHLLAIAGRLGIDLTSRTSTARGGEVSVRRERCA